MIRDLSPIVGQRLSLAVVPDWYGKWPLAAHPDFCRFVQESSDELLLHGYLHERRRSLGPVTLLADRCDEMNGLDRDETRHTLERGQRVFTNVFGEPARGFIAPGWQLGHVRKENLGARLDYLLGYFSLETRAGRKIPLATWTWDCGHWGWFGHIGNELGSLIHSLNGRLPTLAIHPKDMERGFWPKILRLTEEFLETGYEPITPARLLEATDVEVAV